MPLVPPARSIFAAGLSGRVDHFRQSGNSGASELSRGVSPEIRSKSGPLPASIPSAMGLDRAKIHRFSHPGTASNRRDFAFLRLFQNSRYYPSLRPRIRELTRNCSTFAGQIAAFLDFRE